MIKVNHIKTGLCAVAALATMQATGFASTTVDTSRIAVSLQGVKQLASPAQKIVVGKTTTTTVDIESVQSFKITTKDIIGWISAASGKTFSSSATLYIVSTANNPGNEVVISENGVKTTLGAANGVTATLQIDSVAQASRDTSVANNTSQITSKDTSSGTEHATATVDITVDKVKLNQFERHVTIKAFVSGSSSYSETYNANGGSVAKVDKTSLSGDGIAEVNLDATNPAIEAAPAHGSVTYIQSVTVK